jgi:hypothetical protein
LRWGSEQGLGSKTFFLPCPEITLTTTQRLANNSVRGPGFSNVASESHVVTFHPSRPSIQDPTTLKQLGCAPLFTRDGISLQDAGGGSARFAREFPLRAAVCRRPSWPRRPSPRCLGCLAARRSGAPAPVPPRRAVRARAASSARRELQLQPSGRGLAY